jgi:hypothetical protein
VDSTADVLQECKSLAELTTTAARIRAVTQYKSGRGTPGGSSSGGTGKGSKVWNATTLKTRMAELHKRLSPEGVRQAAQVVVARAEQLIVNSKQRKEFHSLALQFIGAINSVLSMPQEDEAVMQGKKRTTNAKSAATHATRQATGNVRTMPKRKAA